ncbi:MAG TPA: hypothetical protein VL122_09035 [Nitrospirota bacterium]|nr:hypothetical protein [Nitrospirota bacterium]
MKKSGNPEGSRVVTDKRKIATHNALVEAYNRLERGKPTVVKKGTLITPSSVAREADVDRNVLYRRHRDILLKIQQTMIERKDGPGGRTHKRNMKEAEVRIKELREAVDILQKEKADMATTLASLHHKHTMLQEDLERITKERNDLRQQLTKIRPLHK